MGSAGAEACILNFGGFVHLYKFTLISVHISLHGKGLSYNGRCPRKCNIDVEHS